MSVGRRNSEKLRFLTYKTLLWKFGVLMVRLTWDGVGKSVGVFGYERVLDVSSAHSMST